MNKTLLSTALLSLMASSSAFAMTKVYDETTLNMAIEAANNDSSISTIVFEKNADIELYAPVIYTGTQNLTLKGNGAIINGANAGYKEPYTDPVEGYTTDISSDGTLMFNTAADISIHKLSVVDSYTRGIVVNVPSDAEGDDISISLNHVNVLNSALYGVHIDDNDNELDDGDTGSNIGINLSISQSNFIANGTGAVDYDGIRVDERSEGSITAQIIGTQISNNGGDGIELDEAGDGDVNATFMNVSMNDNGAQNEEDWDDAFDIDEADNGDINVTLVNVELNNNKDEGLDFDEAGEGSVTAKLLKVSADNNSGEAFKVDEEDAGDVTASLSNVIITQGGDDGLQITELGEGQIDATFNKVSTLDNKKYGIKIEQWVEEDEDNQIEPEGSVQFNNVTLDGNGKGDDAKTHGVIID